MEIKTKDYIYQVEPVPSEVAIFILSVNTALSGALKGRFAKVYLCTNMPDGRLNRKCQGIYIVSDNIILLNYDTWFLTDNWKETILHEICHFLCHKQKIKQVSPHDKNWIKLAEWVSDKVGITIDVNIYKEGGKLYEGKEVLNK